MPTSQPTNLSSNIANANLLEPWPDGSTNSSTGSTGSTGNAINSTCYGRSNMSSSSSYTNGSSVPSASRVDRVTASAPTSTWGSPTQARLGQCHTTHASNLVTSSARTPAAWEAVAVEAPHLLQQQHQQQQALIPPPTSELSTFEFGSTYDDEVDDDDDDSYHDLDAVMALVASPEFSSRSNGDQESFAPPRTTHHWLTPETRVGATDSTTEPNEVPALPRQYASSTVVVAEEATVLETTTSLYAAQWQQQSDDARLASDLREEDDLLLAMKLSAYEGGGGTASTRRKIRTNGTLHPRTTAEIVGEHHQEATVVAIDDRDSFSRSDRNHLYSSSYSSNDFTTVRAEWIGQDFDSPAVASTSNSAYHAHTQSAATDSNNSNHARAASATALVESDDDDTREATVIDSAPLEKNDIADLTYTEEAQVLVDDQSHNLVDNDDENDVNDENELDDMDRKPAARRTLNSSARGGYGGRASLEADVVAIQERRDIHPSEHTFERAFQAELVGTDYSYTVAVPSSSQTSAVADRGAVLSSTRRHGRLSHNDVDMVHSTTTASTHSITSHQAMAFVSPVCDDDTVDSETVFSTVAASAVPESDRDFASDFVDESAGERLEEAHVFISEDGDSMLWDQKPAAILNGSHKRKQSRNGSRSSSTLPMINEHEADIVSISENRERLDNNHFPANDVIEEFHLSETTPPTATAVFEETSRDTGSILFDSVQIASPAISMRPFYSERTNTRGDLIPDQAAQSVALSEDDIENSYVNSIGEGYLVEDVRLADIIDVQEAEDIHPADLTSTDLTETSAELVGSIVASHDGSWNEDEPASVTASAVLAPIVATEIISMSQLVEATSNEVRIEQSSLSVTMTATAFLDPVVETEDNLVNDMVGSDKIPASQLSTPISDERAQVPEIPERIQCGIDVAQPDFDIFNTNTLGVQALGTIARESSTTTADSESNHTSTSHRSGIQSVATVNIQMLSGTLTRGTSAVIDALFGGSSPPFVPKRTRSAESDNTVVRAVSSRTLLPWSVINQKSSGMWIATLQTNQRALDKNDVVEASKSLRAFSMPNENQALSLARTWTPPRMLPFANHKVCHVCKSKFAILRRACHCRNCGVCVCKDCVVPWPARMIPETYNIKKEHSVNACLSCNWLSNSFRLALLEGNRDQAVALNSTGNLNLHSPFANVKGELFFPVHCAVLGGSLELLKFLVDDSCCPIKSVRVAGSGKDSANKYTPIVTSKGRSLLGIAMENENLLILRYLVAEKGILLSGERDVTQDLLCRNLEKLLRCIPEDSIVSAATDGQSMHALTHSATDDGYHYPGMSGNGDGLDPSVTPTGSSGTIRSPDQQSSLNDEARHFGAISMQELYQRGIDGCGDLDLATDEAMANEECIICFDRSIDCVATPCGHQICCLVCSENLDSRCPVCSSICTFMRIYKT